MPSRSVTRTIRLDKEDIEGALKEYSEREGVSVNFLINKALRKYVEWDMFADKFGMISIPSSLLSKLMNLLTDDQVRQLGKWSGENHVREFMFFWFKEVSFHTIFRHYPKLTSQYARMFEYEEHFKDGQWTLLLNHDMGSKWSIYYEELVKGVFSTVLSIPVEVTSTENQVMAKFKVV